MDSPLGTSDGLHFTFQSDVVLFSGLQLSSWASFLAASALTGAVCLSERGITLLLARRYYPAKWREDVSPIKITLWRTFLYALAVTLRLLYMLVAMTLHIGIIAVIVILLATGQLYIEYREASEAQSHATTASPIRNRSVYAILPHHHTHSPSSAMPFRLDDDFELARSPSSGTWDGNREARDKARLVMLGTTDSCSNSGPLSSHSQYQQGYNGTGPRSPRNVSPIHRRQLSRSSASSLQNARGNGIGGRVPSTLTPSNSARKALFQIGSGDDRTSDSD